MSFDERLLDWMTRRIEFAGSDNLEVFGGLYEGGYHIQQAPEELARFTLLLAALGPFESSLEIGIASGGTTRFLREHVEIRSTVTIDDGLHPKSVIWQRENRHAVANVTEFRGNSHSTNARQFLLSLNRTFDLVLIDGDHSAEGVRADWTLVQPFLRRNAVVWFHDIIACPGVRDLWQELRARFPVILETQQLGSGVFRFLQHPEEDRGIQ